MVVSTIGSAWVGAHYTYKIFVKKTVIDINEAVVVQEVLSEPETPVSDPDFGEKSDDNLLDKLPEKE